MRLWNYKGWRKENTLTQKGPDSSLTGSTWRSQDSVTPCHACSGSQTCSGPCVLHFASATVALCQQTHIVVGSSWILRKLLPLIWSFSTHVMAQQPVERQSQVSFGERPNTLPGGEGSLCGAATVWGCCSCNEQGLVGGSWVPREKSRGDGQHLLSMATVLKQVG